MWLSRSVHSVSLKLLFFPCLGVSARVPEEEAGKHSWFQISRQQLIIVQPSHPTEQPLHPGVPSLSAASAGPHPSLPRWLLHLINAHPPGWGDQSPRSPGGIVVQAPGQQQPVVRCCVIYIGVRSFKVPMFLHRSTSRWSRYLMHPLCVPSGIPHPTYWKGEPKSQVSDFNRKMSGPCSLHK